MTSPTVPTNFYHSLAAGQTYTVPEGKALTWTARPQVQCLVAIDGMPFGMKFGPILSPAGAVIKAALGAIALQGSLIDAADLAKPNDLAQALERHTSRPK